MENSDDIPEHPDGLSFPEDGIQTVEGPNGHQRVMGQAARYLYAGFDEMVKVVVETTHHDLDKTERSYRAILRDQGGGIHLAGGGGDVHWIDLDYGWEDVLAVVDNFIDVGAHDERGGNGGKTTHEVVEGGREYRQLRAQMN